MAPPLPPAGPDTIEARFHALHADNAPIRGFPNIAKAVSRVLDTSCSVATAKLLATPGYKDPRLPVWKFAYTQKVFMLPKHLLAWAVLVIVPHGAMKPRGAGAALRRAAR